MCDKAIRKLKGFHSILLLVTINVVVAIALATQKVSDSVRNTA